MGSDDSVSGEFQRSTRMPLDAVVRLHFQGTVAYQNGFAANVSASGMFVKHPAPPPLGTKLVFEFNLGAERKPVQGAGEVVWVRERYLGPGQPAGVGIRFLQLDSQSRDHIAEALFDFLEQSLAEDSLLDSSGFGFAADAPTAVESATADARAADSPDADDFRGAPLFAPADGDDTASASSGALSSPDAVPTASFDFPDLERLPRPSAAAAPAEGKRAFSVFSPLDEADSQTAQIVREALRPEPPLPSMAAAAAAASERPGSRLWILLLLAAVAGGGYLAWNQWGASWLARPSADEDAPLSTAAPESPAPRRPEPLTAAPAPGTTLAETIGVDRKALSPATAPPHSEPPIAPREEPSDVAAALEERAAAAAPADTEPATEPAPAGTTPPRPPANLAPAAPIPSATAPAAGAARAQRLTNIEWRESGEPPGQTALLLHGDGVFAPGTFSYSEIGGENPRVLIKLKGMQNPYRGPAPRAPQVGGSLVRGVRTGFHLTTNGNEIHVVVDLARGGVKVVSLTPGTAGLTLALAP